MFLILGFTVIFFKSLIKYYIFIIAVSIFLLSFYILPMLYYSPYVIQGSIYSTREIFGGYGIFYQSTNSNCYSLLKLSSNTDLLNHFFNVLIHLFQAFTKIVTPYCDASWESTMFIGYFGTCIILISLLFFIYKGIKFSTNNKKILFLIIVISMLSLSIILRYLTIGISLIYDFPKIDRLPSRLMLYPLFCLLAFCAVTFDRINKKYIPVLKTFFLIQCIEMLLYFDKWTLVNVEKSYSPPLTEERLFPLGRILDYSFDLHYISIVNISISISIFSLLMVLLVLYGKNKLK